MASVRVYLKVNRRGFSELRNMDAVQALCLKGARRMATSAQAGASRPGAEYAADVRPGRTRCHARAKTANEAAWWNEKSKYDGANRSLGRQM